MGFPADNCRLCLVDDVIRSVVGSLLGYMHVFFLNCDQFVLLLAFLFLLCVLTLDCCEFGRHY